MARAEGRPTPSRTTRAPGPVSSQAERTRAPLAKRKLPIPSLTPLGDRRRAVPAGDPRLAPPSARHPFDVGWRTRPTSSTPTGGNATDPGAVFQDRDLGIAPRVDPPDLFFPRHPRAPRSAHRLLGAVSSRTRLRAGAPRVARRPSSRRDHDRSHARTDSAGKPAKERKGKE